jgi:hypothetical protein
MGWDALHTTNMLSKEVFEKATRNKVNFCSNQNEIFIKQIQTNHTSIGKYIPAYSL